MTDITKFSERPFLRSSLSSRFVPDNLKNSCTNERVFNQQKIKLSENVKIYCNLHLDLLQLRNNENLTIWDILTFHDDHHEIFNTLDELVKTFNEIDYLFIITFMEITLNHTYTHHSSKNNT